MERPIKDIVVPFWMEAMKDCGKEDFVFSKGLKPGSEYIRPEQVSRRWKRHIKGKLGIDADFYSLKYLNTTATVDILEQIKDSQRLVSGQTGHKSEAMVVKIYDSNAKKRNDEQLKKVANKFG